MSTTKTVYLKLKLIKRTIFKEVKDQAAYFGINLMYVDTIKKIKWV